MFTITSIVIVTLIKNVGKPTFIFTDFLHFILPFTNDLEYYNRNLATSKNKNKREEEYTKSMYEEIPNILYAGYEVIEEPEVDISRKQTLERLSKEIINVLKCTSKEEYRKS